MCREKMGRFLSDSRLWLLEKRESGGRNDTTIRPWHVYPVNVEEQVSRIILMHSMNRCNNYFNCCRL